MPKQEAGRSQVTGQSGQFMEERNRERRKGKGEGRGRGRKGEEKRVQRSKCVDKDLNF